MGLNKKTVKSIAKQSIVLSTEHFTTDFAAGMFLQNVIKGFFQAFWRMLNAVFLSAR